MIYYDRNYFALKGTGLAVTNVSFTSQNGTNILNSVGGFGQAVATNGAISAKVDVSYYVNLSSGDYNITWASGIKHQNLTNPELLQFNGVSGMFYLNSFGFDIVPNSLISAKANYVSFTEISGSLREKVAGDNVQNIEMSGLAHSWASPFSTNTLGTEYKTTDVNYQISFDWNPVYKIGQKTPFQVLCVGANEDLSITREFFTGLSFQAQSLSDVLGVTSITLRPIKQLYLNVGGEQTINLLKHQITESSFDGAVNDYVKCHTKSSTKY